MTEREQRKAAAREAIEKIVRRAQVSRLPPPAFSIEPASHDGGAFAIDDDDLDAILGADADGLFSPLASVEYPILHGLYEKYRSASPGKKYVRVETQESHDRFLDKRRGPYLAELAERVAHLEAAFKEHTKDGHGGLSVTDHDLDVMGAAVEEAKERATCCGDRIPLSLEPAARGKIESWQDGREILTSVRMGGRDGKARIATTGAPFERYAVEALDYAMEAGIDPLEVQGVLPVVAQVLGGGALATQLCRASSTLLAQPEVGGCFIGKITPMGDAGLAAMMALLQQCEGGDAAACAEKERARSTAQGSVLVAKAETALMDARKKLGRVR